MATDMALNQGLWTELRQIFEQDIPNTAELLDLLKRERSALEKRDYNDFQQIISSKHTLLQILESHAKSRQQLLLAAGFDDEPSTLAAAEKQAPWVAKAWRSLGEQWKACQELNEINERIARRTRLVVGQILELLRGTSGEAKVYDNKGGTKSTGGGHTITSA